MTAIFAARELKPPAQSQCVCQTAGLVAREAGELQLWTEFPQQDTPQGKVVSLRGATWGIFAVALAGKFPPATMRASLNMPPNPAKIFFWLKLDRPAPPAPAPGATP